MHRSRSSGAKEDQLSIPSALKDALDEARRRRWLVRWAVLGVTGALIVFGLLVFGGQ